VRKEHFPNWAPKKHYLTRIIVNVDYESEYDSEEETANSADQAAEQPAQEAEPQAELNAVNAADVLKGQPSAPLAPKKAPENLGNRYAHRDGRDSSGGSRGRSEHRGRIRERDQDLENPRPRDRSRSQDTRTTGRHDYRPSQGNA
jgi:pyruvate/2-oxoglutarate dehydrogenase complex dihydrolipoamide acyltransferase (E2) component